MINSVKYAEILDSGLLLDHYLILSNIKNKVEPLKNKRVQGFINLLEKKGYLEEGSLTEKGIDLVQDIEAEVSAETEQDDFATWVQELHLRCQDKLLELTGSKQVRDKIDRKGYSFLPNSVDLGKVLLKVVTLYKIKDYKRIESCIMNYIEKCSEAKNWFPILQYYILKSGKSNLVTDCENLEEDTPEIKSSQKFI